MSSRHVTDLYSVIEPHVSELQIDDGCHFTLQGYEYLGKQVAESIMAGLPARVDHR
jgi:hypothetical protein